MNGSKFETNIENGEARMTREAESLCYVHPMSGGLGSRPLKMTAGQPSLLESRFQRLIVRVSNPWGDAPGGNDVTPLALKQTQAACGFD